MRKFRPEKPDPENTDRTVAADAPLRQEPDEGGDEEEDEGDREQEDEDDNTTDDGYSK